MLPFKNEIIKYLEEFLEITSPNPTILVETKYYTYGICLSILNKLIHLDTTGDFDYQLHYAQYKQFMQEVCKKWPEFSGNIKYPVPHTYLDAEQGYKVTKSKWIGVYGDTRRRYAKFLIEELKKL